MKPKIFTFLQYFQSQTKVNLQLEISVQHHEFVKGKDFMELKDIMTQTKTTV